MESSLPIRRVLISVFDKSNILNFAQFLFQHGAQLLSTNNTAHLLSTSGIKVLKISDYTKFPEIMNGRLKTLHHKIYAGILYRKGLDDSIINQHNIYPIDMVIINFYPFQSIFKNQTYSHQEILEYIDIGGPSIIRAAAKNYKNIVVITDYKDYQNILHEMNKNHGSISLQTRFHLASKAFQYVAKYDAFISEYFNTQLPIYSKNKPESCTNKHTQYSCTLFPKTINCMNLNFIKKQNLIYGENPHQQAALYVESNLKQSTGSIATAQQLQGKPLSYNNIMDMDTALECVKMFQKPTCVIVKHATPCGVATSDIIETAYQKAYQADPISAFGGIIAFNRSLNQNTAQAIITQNFVEAIIAPDIHQDCLNILSKKKNIRVLKIGTWNYQNKSNNSIDFKKIDLGLLVQKQDTTIDLTKLEIVTIRQPTAQEMEDALFCWKIVKFVKSNAIVCGKNYQTTGIGAGQPNRVHSVKIATLFQNQNSIKISGSSMASDAFFTFPDGINIAAKMGIRCIIQPGGSIQDLNIIKTANQHNISMIFTHIRHFRH